MSLSFSANSVGGLRSDVQAHPVGGDRVGRDDLVVGVGGERGGGDDVDGQDDLDALGLGLVEVALARRRRWSASSRLLPTSWPWALRKVNTIPPPMSRRSAVCSRLSMTPSLSDDLGAAEHDGIRALGVLGEALEHVDLGATQSADGVRQQAGDVVDRRLLAVHDAEAVGDEDVGERGERVGELGPLLVGLGGLARVEPEVLQQDDVTRRPAAATAAWADSPTVSVAKATSRPSSSPSRFATGASEYLSSGAPLGRPRWAQTTTRRARLGEGLDRRDGRLDAAVVGDRLPVQRDVEVGPDEYPLAAQVAVRQEVGESARPTLRGPCRRARRGR